MPKAMTDAMTADEFFEWCHRPENRDKHYELERGRVVEVSRPGERHGFVCANGVGILWNYTFQRGKGYVLSNDTGIIWEHHPDTVKGPDIAYYDDAGSFEELNPKYSEQTPQLIVEVFSPNDRWSKFLKRITQFQRWGVPLVWVVHPEDRTVTVFRRGEFAEVLTEDEELTGNGILPDFRCRVVDFFFRPGEKRAETPAS
jgi:Uma2 family endonuclease